MRNHRADCRACGKRDFIHLAGEGRPTSRCAEEIPCKFMSKHRPLSFSEMSAKLKPLGNVRHNEFVLKFWREPYEITLFPDGRAIIKGTTDTAVARSLYARYIGS